MRLLKVAAVAAALSVSSPALASLDVPSGTYLLDPTHTSVVFKVSHLGLSNYTMRFNEMKGTLELDAEQPANSALSVIVYPTSLRTGYPNAHIKDFDKELQEGEVWLNATTYPEITFKSTSMTQTGPNSGIVEGELTLLGVTKPVSLDVTLNGTLTRHPFVDAAAVGISAVGSLKRSEFGMTQQIPAIGDEVQIIIEAELIQQK